MKRLFLLVALPALSCAQPGADVSQETSLRSNMEGTFEYVGGLAGQSIIFEGRFVFLYGPSDGSGPMTGEAGTYTITADTAVHTVSYSTDPERVGTTFMWTPEAISGDTVSYVVMDGERAVTGRGRSVRIR